MTHFLSDEISQKHEEVLHPTPLRSDLGINARKFRFKLSICGVNIFKNVVPKTRIRLLFMKQI